MAECIRMVWGEARGCTYEEMIMVALVYWNRAKSNIRFNKPEKDFLGLQQNLMLNVDNEIQKKAFFDVVRACEHAQILSENHEDDNILFFNLHGNKPKTKYKTQAIKKDNFAHTFFRIQN
ncbi:MAG TPA: hypothetical protein VK982_02060 [Bacteroidales bacterium]|nr:hypothetical protein [Bacteroidales bacterium]